jgi:hypothetical protein
MARDTKLGSGGDHRRHSRMSAEAALAKLDEAGHRLYVGAEVARWRHPGGQGHAEGREPQLTPEEKLLRAIFGEKASDVQRHVACGFLPVWQARWWMCGCFTRAWRRQGRSARWPLSGKRPNALAMVRKDMNEQLRIHGPEDAYRPCGRNA